jgi:hypothetical protein
LIVALILGWKILTQSLHWIFLKSIKIGFRAIKVAKMDVADTRRLVRGILRQVARDF